MVQKYGNKLQSDCDCNAFFISLPQSNIPSLTNYYSPRMINIKRLAALFSVTFLLTALNAWGQTQSDVSISEGGYGMVKTNITTSYDHRWGDIQDGFSARVSYEFFRNRKFTLTANARYSSVETSFSAADLTEGFNPDEIDLNGTHLMGQVGVTSTFRTRVAGKPIMGMAMVNSEWGDGGFARISGIAMGLVMLRANRNTQFGIGPIVLVNSCSKIPAFLVFMYRHRFNEKWLINLYGGMMGVDYTPSRDDLLSLGADVDVKAFYFRPHSAELPGRCRFTSTSFRPMVKYRRRLGTNLYFDIQAGAVIKMSCRVNGTTGSTEYLECRQKAAPFIQAGVSYSL